MAAKKTTKTIAPAAPEKAAPVKAAKKAAKATDSPAAAAAAKKTAAKTTAATKVAKPISKPAVAKRSPDEIARAAYLNYRRRVEQGLPGDSHGDWLEAEKQ